VCRCACLDNSQAQQFARQWSLELDSTLAQFVNVFSRRLAVTPARLHPHEIYLSQADLASEQFAPLQGKFSRMLLITLNLFNFMVTKFCGLATLDMIVDT